MQILKDATTFAIWEAELTIFLGIKDLGEIADGTENCPTKTAEKKKCILKDNNVKNYVLRTVGKKVKPHIIHCVHGIDMFLKMQTLYKINYKQCEKVYIRQTKRNLETRTKEHFRNLRLNNTDQSTIASHFWNTGHEINKTASILKSVNKKIELITWEKIFIHKYAYHILVNFEVPPVSSLIKMYICRITFL